MINKKKWLKLSPVVVLLAALLVWLFIHFSHKASSDFTQVTSVYVEKPKIWQTATRVSVLASVIPKRETYIMPKVPGYIALIQFSEGQYVKKGQPIIQLDSTKAQAQLDADKTNMMVAQKQYERDKLLIKHGLVTKPDMGTDHAKYANTAATVVMDQKLLDENSLEAPFSGYLGAKTVSRGDYVTAAQKLVLLVDKNHLLAEYNLPERYVPLLKLGQYVDIRDNLEPGQRFKGKVVYIAPNINTDTNTITVHAAINDPKHELVPGQYVTVKQQFTQAQSMLFVPEQSIIASLKGNFVFTVDNGKAKRLAVTTAEHKNGYVAITTGLSSKTLVVTAGQHELKDGGEIAVKQSDA